MGVTLTDCVVYELSAAQYKATVDPTVLGALKEKVQKIQKIAEGNKNRADSDKAINALVVQTKGSVSADGTLISRRNARKAAAEMVSAAASEADAPLKEKMNKFSGGANVLSGRVDRKHRKIKRSATIAAPTMSSALN